MIHKLTNNINYTHAPYCLGVLEDVFGIIQVIIQPYRTLFTVSHLSSKVEESRQEEDYHSPEP